MPEASKPSLLGLDREGLRETLSAEIDRAYRVDQIYRALYERRVESFDEMTDLGLLLRRRLEEKWQIGRPEVVDRVVSADGTVKVLLRLEDGATVEAVDIPDGDRRTLCLSSQAGCALACTFCVTGYWGAGRDLTPGEIVGQVHAILGSTTDAPDAAGLNLVFMGMGEPLLNLAAVEQSLQLFTERLSWRRVTVSTAGVVPGIEQMSRWPRRPNLAISLHAADDELRSRLMPINRKYPLERLLGALRAYPLERGRRITFEYTLIEGVNDRPEDPAHLVRLLRGLRAKVNLIPLNPDPVLGELRPSSWQRVLEFQSELNEKGLRATVRRPRGDDVGAACGQLRAFGRAPRARSGSLTASAR